MQSKLTNKILDYIQVMKEYGYKPNLKQIVYEFEFDKNHPHIRFYDDELNCIDWNYINAQAGYEVCRDEQLLFNSYY